MPTGATRDHRRYLLPQLTWMMEVDKILKDRFHAFMHEPCPLSGFDSEISWLSKESRPEKVAY